MIWKIQQSPFNVRRKINIIRKMKTGENKNKKKILKQKNRSVMNNLLICVN